MATPNEAAFVNPYTFIPLRKRTEVQQLGSEAGEALLTGAIRCTLTTKTPLVIPASKVDVDHPEVATPFFKVGGIPIIPGSSLRGPIRSVYETLTNSCMRVNGGNLHSVGGRKLPGLLGWSESENGGRGGYVLHKALRYRVDARMARGWRTGELAFVTTGPEPKGRGFMASEGVVQGMSRDAGAGSVQGYYLHVNQMDGKTANKPSVFVKGDRVKGIVDPSFIGALRETVDLYVQNCRDDSNPGEGSIAEEYEAQLRRLLAHEKGVMLPVWYSYERLGDGSYAYALAPSQLSRSVYPVTPITFVEGLGLGPCATAANACPACDLFGFVADGQGDAKAGKVRFTDARPIGEARLFEATLPALMGPRTSAFEFYLRNDDHRQSFSPLTPGTQLAGRKMYWHSQRGLLAPEQQFEEGSAINNARVECVDAGESFTFSVYVDGVTRQQLNELVYVLTLGDAWGAQGDSVSSHCHKIGHGKPVGAGSVLITVDSVCVRSYASGSYTLCSDDGWKLELGKEGLSGVLRRLDNTEAVRKVTQFTTIPKEAQISYPRERRGGDIFTWFKDNRVRSFRRQNGRGGADDSKTLPGYRATLPFVTDASQAMPRDPELLEDPEVEGATHPPVEEYASGTIYELTVRNDGRWSGRIKRDDDPRGDRLLFFRGDENTHIANPVELRRGMRVTFVPRQAEHHNKRTGRTEMQTRAFGIAPD